MKNYEQLELEDVTQFDFEKYRMIRSVFQIRRLLGNQLGYLPPIKSIMLDKLRSVNLDLDNYKMIEGDYGDISIRIKTGTKSYKYTIIITIKKYNCVSVEVVRDNKVLKRWER